ncbi:DUF2934 domain-containing protein [Acuticoccus sp. M5D2P5]|uniref:DUF2934 domain-containing protein n=1 Tax=Acuticoccus kalidii TaxID=2910977 RepID=UPI001F2E74EA|nr:DUF2934 domain-containing protein [Acuticoccus kalidii]MCF3935304.1 DUF2934 domain-containing protein [Acuticoccus kalidii]
METPNDHEQRIRERAYAIWKRDGQPDGRHSEHWNQAERELQDALGGDLAPMPDGGSTLRDEKSSAKKP